MIESLDGSHHGLRVSFVWHRDRYAHTIAVVQEGRVLPLMASHEGSAEQPWPLSPPFQQLSTEERDGGQVALLVGMAGTSHWSMSVEAARGERSLVFDVACRANSAPVRLASSYRTMMPAEVKPDGSSAGWVIGGRSCRLLVRELERPVRILDTPDGLAMECTTACSSLPATLRWQYRIELADAAAQ